MFMVNNLIGFSGRQATAAFVPSDISNLQLWFDATVGVIDGGDGSVETWNDQSGNGDNATQVTAADKLTTDASTQNGLNILDADGSGGADHFDLPADIGMTGATNRTFFFVGEPDTESVFLSQGDGTSNRFTFRNAGAGTDLRVEIQGQGATSSIAATVFGIFGCMLDGSTLADTIVFSASTDETLVGGNTINTLTGDNYIGAVQTTGGFLEQPFTSVGEIIAYGKELTVAERNQVGNYLADRWGLTWTDRV